LKPLQGMCELRNLELGGNQLTSFEAVEGACVVT